MINLATESFETFYAGEPSLEIIARALSRYEQWTFDNDEFGPLPTVREQMLTEASRKLASSWPALQPSVELIRFLLALSSIRRLPLLSYLGEVNPSLVPELTNFAYQQSETDPFCAQFISWMDAIDFALEALRGDDSDGLSVV